ncbi:MAG TPA: hypothetical protein VGK40_04685 [Verrucomicrobiae bacterium]|jgi:hypothetical protein
MSLINDALRRTSRSQAPPATPAKTPPLQPVEPARSHAHFALVLAPVIILLLGLAGWFWVKWWESSTQMNQTSNPTRVAAREVPRAPDPTPGLSPGDGLPPREPVTRGSAPVGFSPLRQNTRPGPLPELPAKAGRLAPAVGSAPDELLATTGPTNMASVPTIANQAITTESAKPATPTFKLQGVFYRPSNPSAVINGKVVYVGDKVGQARVLAIERDEVLIENDGQRTVLSLP